MNTEGLINDFAIRSFRDIADYDYIAARMAYRARLFPQFLWSGQQAIEKYLKCILLFNRMPARTIGHNLTAALSLLQKAPFELRLREPSKEIIRFLDTFGRFRYFETPFHILGFEIARLDMAVWDMRRYCIIINYTDSNGTKQSMLTEMLEKIEASEKQAPHRFRINGGVLEKILDDSEHPARKALIWQNLSFGVRARKRVRLHRHIQASNSPLSMHPEILDEILQYVFLPREVVNAYKTEFAMRSKHGK